jgi:E3 ubiquitin-protein ligase HUWE1
MPEDDDEDDDMDEEMLFEQAYPGTCGIRSSHTLRLMIQADGVGPIFGWEGDVEPPTIISHRGHQGRHRHAFPSPFPFIPAGSRDPLGGMLQPQDFPIISVAVERDEAAFLLGLVRGLNTGTRTNHLTGPDYRYRSHRSGAPPAQSDDGTNPLLQRHGSGASSRQGHSRGPPMGSWVQTMGPGGNLIDMGIGFGGRHEHPPDQIMDMIRSLRLPGAISRHGQTMQFHITAGPGPFPRELEAFLGGNTRPRVEGRRDATEPGSATSFTTHPTHSRWLEEAKLLFGPAHTERATDLTSAILAVLVPPTIEADKVLRAAENERIRKLEEEAKKRQEEERLAREAREAEEKAVREKKEAEEREAAERAAAEAAAAREAESDVVNEEEPVGSNGPEAMEGIETNESEQAPNTEAQGDNEPAADRPRVMTVIRGNPFDITDLGIDAEFLSELPEEIREEVIMTAVAERRQQAAATGAQPSDIDQEFLDALPDDIRDEIIQQERQDRRRREREEQRRAQAPNAGAPPVARDMDVPSILATFPPALRQEILMDGDEELLASLPPDLAAQARSMRRAQPEHAGRAPAAVNRRVLPGEESRSAPQQPKPRRAIVQMLDKQGIATLLRLMFVFQHTSFRNTLNAVLQHVSLNKHNRAELISTLLHILQDGSADMNAIERSFSYLSLRAKQPKDKDPKTPQQTLRRTLTGLGTLAQMNSEASPLMVVQQCLTCLVYLAQHSPHVASFFLTEHEPAGGLKRSLSRKGKGKDSKAPRYALNSLLSLLDRELIMESANVMESLSLLLNIVTTPLIALERKQKEAAEEAEKAKEAAAKSAGESSGSAVPENTVAESSTSTNDQPSEQPLALPEVPTPAVADAPSTSSSVAHAPPPLIIPTNNSNVEEASAVPGEESAKLDAPTKEENKKPHSFTPPVIPEHNLRLVTNIFCCECNSKTFRETISTIKNLSTIPGAKAIFGKELIAKAQSLGEVILMDLQELLPQIQKARTGTEIQGVALAKFSPPASDQHKLLRVLTALDHLFDPKREKKDETDTQGSSELMEKQDLLSSLYENSTFGPMWEKLSACLSAIRQRDHMLSVATILLPLIESLMVVCKNTTLKDVPITRSSKMKDSVLTSPAPESRMESLFFTFTEEHRKILNDLVRHTPKLMSGTFSLLVKNPKVLEFDNKRNYFSRSIHNRGQAGRSVPPLQLSVRREQVFHDSFKSLYFQTPDQMKYGKLSIRFHGEEGVDAGGVTREWFQVLSRQMFDPGYALFIPVSSDRTTFHPNQLSSVNEEHLMFFKFIGRIIGKALYEGRVLDCHFSRAVYKRILGKSVSVKDMESLDPDYYKSLVWMLENDITDIITETFSVDNDKFGVVETIDFIENGRNIPVTEENKHEYVRLMVEWKLTGSVKEQLDEFLKGKVFLIFKLAHALTLF